MECGEFRGLGWVPRYEDEGLGVVVGEAAYLEGIRNVVKLFPFNSMGKLPFNFFLLQFF